MKYTVALVQMDSQNDRAENMERAARFIDEAAERGAVLVSLPEVMNYIAGSKAEDVKAKEAEEGGETLPGYSTEILMQKAKEHGIYIHSGSFTEKNPAIQGRHYNTSVMIDDTGEIIATYRKLHTFDVVLPDGTVYNESEKIAPGEKIVTADTKLGKLGFSICYDIRFPELFRLMALKGVQIFFTPANFTVPTGQHWEPLLRARAIENGCYVIAAAQIGKKPHFSAYGNSMVVDPWGTVIAHAKNEVGVTYAEIDLDFQEKIRKQIPSLKNRRADVYCLR